MAPLASNTLSTPPGQLDEIFYGFLVSIILFGISVTQAWTYVNTNRDTWVVRVWVVALLICNLAHIITVSQAAHYFLVPHSGIATVLASPTRLFETEWILVGVIQTSAQLYFARAIYLFRKKLWFPAAIVFLCIMLLVANIYAFIRPVVDKRVLPSLGVRVEVLLFHTGAVVVDIVTTVGMWSMFSPKHYFVLRTRTILEKLIMYTVARGLLLTVAQVLHLIAVATKPADIIFWFPTQVILSNLCISTLLAILNARTAFREIESDNPQASSLRFATPPQTIGSRYPTPENHRTVNTV